jgi:hypothetical protein
VAARFSGSVSSSWTCPSSAPERSHGVNRVPGIGPSRKVGARPGHGSFVQGRIEPARWHAGRLARGNVNLVEPRLRIRRSVRLRPAESLGRRRADGSVPAVRRRHGALAMPARNDVNPRLLVRDLVHRPLHGIPAHNPGIDRTTPPRGVPDARDLGSDCTRVLREWPRIETVSNAHGTIASDPRRAWPVPGRTRDAGPWRP